MFLVLDLYAGTLKILKIIIFKKRDKDTHAPMLLKIIEIYCMEYIISVFLIFVVDILSMQK